MNAHAPPKLVAAALVMFAVTVAGIINTRRPHGSDHAHAEAPSNPQRADPARDLAQGFIIEDMKDLSTPSLDDYTAEEIREGRARLASIIDFALENPDRSPLPFALHGEMTQQMWDDIDETAKVSWTEAMLKATDPRFVPEFVRKRCIGRRDCWAPSEDLKNLLQMGTSERQN